MQGLVLGRRFGGGGMRWRGLASDDREGEQVHMQFVVHLCITGILYSATRRKT